VDLPSEDSLRWIVSRYATLRAEHGEGIGDPHLVQPTPEDFPDAFEMSAQGVGQFLARMLVYAPVASDLDVRLRVFEAEGGGGGGSCGTGGCGSGACETKGDAPRLGDRVIDAEQAYIVEMPTGAAGHPVKLAATLARSVGAIVLAEAGEEVEPSETAAMAEVAGAACGFGVLLTLGANIFGKSCGGVRIEQATLLSVAEHAVLLALFVRLHGIKPSVAKEHLEPTQAECFAEALAWVDSNKPLVLDLAERPEVLVDGVFPLSPVKGLLGRWLGGGAKAAPTAEEIAPPASKRAPRSKEEQEKIDRAKAIVDAALPRRA
jgi:hypothetical protein